MKNLKEIIFEKLKINSKSKIHEYTYSPTNWEELKKLVKQLIKERGTDANLNDIDVSKMKTLSNIFSGEESDFNGDISQWDVSNIEYMEELFNDCKFDGDISQWNVSNVKSMFGMFAYSEFTGKNGDIGKWDVSKVKDMQEMFYHSKFEGNISDWKIDKNTNTTDVIAECPLEKNPPKWYKDE